MERFALQGLGSAVLEGEVLVEPTENPVTNGATVGGAAERQDEILRHRPAGGSIEPESLDVRRLSLLANVDDSPAPGPQARGCQGLGDKDASEVMARVSQLHARAMCCGPWKKDCAAVALAW